MDQEHSLIKLMNKYMFRHIGVKGYRNRRSKLSKIKLIKLGDGINFLWDQRQVAEPWPDN